MLHRSKLYASSLKSSFLTLCSSFSYCRGERTLGLSDSYLCIQSLILVPYSSSSLLTVLRGTDSRTFGLSPMHPVFNLCSLLFTPLPAIAEGNGLPDFRTFGLSPIHPVFNRKYAFGTVFNPCSLLFAPLLAIAEGNGLSDFRTFRLPRSKKTTSETDQVLPHSSLHIRFRLHHQQMVC